MRSVASDELHQMMQRRMSQENPIRASETEFVQRLQRLVVLAVNRLIYYDVSEDLFDLLNIPDSPDHHIFTPDPGDQAPYESGSSSVPHSPTPFILPHASKKSFQKDILKLMMDGIKISLVGPVFFFLSKIFSCCIVHLLAKCLCRVATGLHGSWRSPKSSVAEDTLVLQGHFQGADRPSSGAHTQLITSTA
ncbi:hypothetical protein XENOCAPTIV_025720 [Xenoophorus captivus]|uniref:Uncharacterized protein n=1 Tax=Xenoophorus captivus TaxID=1517983 RepID=A0ABV0QWL8_9TELE